MTDQSRNATFTLTPEAAEVLSQGFSHPIFQTYKPLRVFHAIGIFAIIKQLHSEGRQVSRTLISEHCGVAYASIHPYIPILEELGLIKEMPDPIPQRRTKILVPLTGKAPTTKTPAKAKAPKEPRTNRADSKMTTEKSPDAGKTRAPTKPSARKR